MSREMIDSGIDWIGRIPKNWEVHPVKHILAERKEINNPITVTDILSLTNTRGVIPYSEKGEIGNKAKEDITGYKIVRENDIVINSMNLYIGSVGLSKYTGVVSPVYYMLYNRNDLHSIDYFSLLFQTKELQSKSHGYGNGILDIRMRIPMSNLNTIPLPVPPNDEQHRIVSVLNKKTTEIDSLISLQEQQIEKLKEYKQSVISKAVTKGLDPNVPMKDSGIKWIGEIPTNWSTMKLRYLASLKTGTTPKENEGINGSQDGLQWYTPGDFNELYLRKSEQYIDIKTISKYNIQTFHPKSILLIGIGATAGKIGFALSESYSNQQITQISPLNIYPDFLLYSLVSQTKMLRDLAMYTTLPILNNRYLKGIFIAVPDTKEQIEICDYLGQKLFQVDKHIKNRLLKIEKLQEFKKSLIYEYVTGKKHVLQ